MKKITLSILFLCSALLVHAGPYFTGVSQLNKLLVAVGQPERPIDNTNHYEESHRKLWKYEAGASWSVPGPQEGWTWSEKNWAASTALARGYDAESGTNGDNYMYLNAIDWSNGKGNGGNKYVQVANLELQQSSPPEEKNELRLLNSINLSGNRFTNFSFDANNVARAAATLTINLSNNVKSDGSKSLQKVTLKNFVTPSQVTLNVSNNALNFGDLAFTLDVQTGINVTRAPQAIRKACIFPVVNLSAELFSAQTVVTFYSGSTLLIAGTAYTVNGDGTFTFTEAYKNTILTCRLTDPAFPEFNLTTNTMTYTIGLAERPEELATVTVTPTSTAAFIGEPIPFSATALDYMEMPAANTTFLWSCTPATSGSFNDATSATPVFTPSAAGSISVKCTATQAGVTKETTATVTSTALTSLSFTLAGPAAGRAYSVYAIGEKVRVTVTANSAAVTRASFLNAIAASCEGFSMDAGNLVFVPAAVGEKSLVISLGTVSSPARNVTVVSPFISQTGMTATASSFNNNDRAPQAIDGNANTRWTVLRDDRAKDSWLLIDMGDSYTVEMVEIDWENAKPNSYEIQVATEETGVYTTIATDGFPNNSNTTNHYFVRLTADPVVDKAKFLKVALSATANGYGSAIWEIKIAGKKWAPPIVENPKELASLNVNPKSSNAFVGEPIKFTAVALDFNSDPAENTTFAWTCNPATAGSFDDATSATPIFTSTAADDIAIKCVATQKDGLKADVLKENIVTITPITLTSLELGISRYYSDIFIQSEMIPVSVSANGNFVTRTSFLDALTLGNDLFVNGDGNGLVYQPSSTGYKQIGISFGGVASMVKSVKVIANRPISKTKMGIVDYSSEAPPHYAVNIISGIDGASENRWQAASTTGEQFVAVDFAAMYKLDMIEISWETASAKDFEVFIGESYEDLYSLSSFTDVERGPLKTRVDGGECDAQFLKILCTAISTSWACSIYEIYLYGAAVVGVDAVQADGQVVSAEYYNLQGIKITQPVEKGGIYIVKKTYDSGKVVAEKLVW